MKLLHSIPQEFLIRPYMWIIDSNHYNGECILRMNDNNYYGNHHPCADRFFNKESSTYYCTCITCRDRYGSYTVHYWKFDTYQEEATSVCPPCREGRHPQVPS